MQKVGDFWVPDIDMRWFRNRRKTIANFGAGGQGRQIVNLEGALAHLARACDPAELAAATAVDAGANVGSYSRRLAEVFARVHAFELAPDTYECLARNVADWGLAGRIVPHQMALSDRPGRVGLSAGGWFRRSVSRGIGGAGDIEAAPLDNLDLGQVLFLKLDVEGVEDRVLAGAAQLIDRCRPYVMMELKARQLDRGKADLSAHNRLLALGYRIVADLGEPVIDRLYAPPGRG